MTGNCKWNWFLVLLAVSSSVTAFPLDDELSGGDDYHPQPIPKDAPSTLELPPPPPELQVEQSEPVPALVYFPPGAQHMSTKVQNKVGEDVNSESVVPAFVIFLSDPISTRADRFRRSPLNGGSYSSSSSQSSSYSGFGGSSSESDSYSSGYNGYGGSGSASQSSSSSQSGFGGRSYGKSAFPAGRTGGDYGAGISRNYGVNDGRADSNLLNRFGTIDADGPAIIARSGISDGNGVFSSSSTSIDSSGKTTYNVRAGKL